MRLLSFRLGPAEVPGMLLGDRVIPLGPVFPEFASPTLLDILNLGPAGLGRAGDAPPPETLELSDLDLASPLRPPSIRDFMAFEGHVRQTRANRGQEVPEAWYRIPVFYFSNPSALVAPGSSVSRPRLSRKLDFEAEVAVVIGVPGINIRVEDAWNHVLGLTVMNDWSARDLQLEEMSVGLGPAKGKDFGTSLGPTLVTLDEVSDRIRGEALSLAMEVRRNGEVFACSNLDQLHHSIPALVAQASRSAWLRTGDVLGTGTMPGGCILERPEPAYLEEGEVVEVEVEGLGLLRNTIATPESD